MTAFLLARGADPQALHNGTPAGTEAELLGHWLAAEIIRAWTKHLFRADQRRLMLQPVPGGLPP